MTFEAGTAQPNTNLDCLKGNVVEDLFVSTADQTYIVARWCFLNRLYLDFYWNAVHSVEKYLKACLLLNGRSSIAEQGKPFNHDIVRLFKAVNEIFPIDESELLTKPEAIDASWWREETVGAFISRINDAGHPNNRYNLYGFDKRPEDLIKLDAVVFRVRNVAQRLDGYAFLGTHKQNGGPNLSGRDLLVSRPDHPFHLLNSRLGQLMSDKFSVDVQRAAKEQNFSFKDEDYKNSPYSEAWSTHNSVIYRRIVAPSKTHPCSGGEDELRLATWILENIKISREDKTVIEEARDKIYAFINNGS